MGILEQVDLLQAKLSRPMSSSELFRLTSSKSSCSGRGPIGRTPSDRPPLGRPPLGQAIQVEVLLVEL